jgi:hypothetical protein
MGWVLSAYGISVAAVLIYAVRLHKRRTTLRNPSPPR